MRRRDNFEANAAAMAAAGVARDFSILRPGTNRMIATRT
jgi:hypothetical protein